MPTNKLTFVPVKLDPIIEENTPVESPIYPVSPDCVIKTTMAEISFFNGVDERIIQTVMKELNKHEA